MDKVAREVAEADFERFCEMLAAYSEAPDLKDEEDRKSFNENKGRFIKAVMSGSLVVADDGTATYTPSIGGAPFVFREPTAAMVTAIDRHKMSHSVTKQLAMIASFAGRPEGEIGKLPVRDMRVLNSIVNGFF